MPVDGNDSRSASGAASLTRRCRRHDSCGFVGAEFGCFDKNGPRAGAAANPNPGTSDVPDMEAVGARPDSPSV
jgi:hypothetical protein